ncbi:MAG: sucrase/ferredoxin-like family protein [Gemmatimonadota bacterium]|nr:sucrase/ferredoxin-like family protein [Gemmatimonadota bacterium]
MRGENPLSDTVKPYHRHVFACTGATSWPARLREGNGLLARMAREVRARRDAGGEIPKLTATDEPSSGSRGYDLLVFPERIRYRSVDGATWRAVLRDHLDGGEPSPAVDHDPLPGRWVFVCVHGERDDRCGRCGPPLIDALREAVRARGLDDVAVRATSHVGGHKYAGNVLVYPGGQWYGYVRPDDADRIVEEHLVEGDIVHDLHRGSMR